MERFVRGCYMIVGGWTMSETKKIFLGSSSLNVFGPRCPSCGNPGRPVKANTLRSLLLPEKRDNIKDHGYYFCSSAVCDTVYFAGNGEYVFTRNYLTVRVGVKEASSPRPICYCFDHTVEEIDEDVRLTGKSLVIEDIKERMKNEGCSCETRNPQGACCLKTVERYVRETLVRYGISVE